MKLLSIIIVALCLVGFSGINAEAQKSKTIILVRHAEKDVSEGADEIDPDLSAAGHERAERLLKVVRRFRPGAVYSSNYKRTRETVEPIAKHRGLEIQTYDPKAQEKLIDQIMSSRTKRFVVAGHSNTVPLLANLLIKKEIFKPLDDGEYGTIWVIRMKKDGPPKIEILNY